MKLYFFEAGILKSFKQYFTLGLGIGEPFDVPVPFFINRSPQRYRYVRYGKCFRNSQ